MPINIKNGEADVLLAELKAATGKGTSQIVPELLRREAQRLRARRVRSADDAEARMAILLAEPDAARYARGEIVGEKRFAGFGAIQRFFQSQRVSGSSRRPVCVSSTTASTRRAIVAMSSRASKPTASRRRSA
ncbi:type II toxin-antitoxin system VapB family antitoxin [Azospirillum rugosum]|uniref:Uncharacterized protein n=1 Tax=Azospirillum rugosum TaxID=416170 RepID=A0ABS4SR66_9PROT|nr:type II toxin-antitoxin system VapB family antitoxin [Azospirillum rugosum]MBP2295068.1 hypothetical protein [Azospirillum rugosum]MDQ0528891.1 hypothetical protein [Azospirillum rugosum]